MNPSIIGNTRTTDPQCFKVFLRIFIERIRKNRDEAPGVFMSELLNKASSSRKSLEEETLQVLRKTTLNHPISTPKEVKVNLKITLDEYETEDNAEDIKDDLPGSSGDEERESKPSKVDNTNISDNSSEAVEGENEETTHDIQNKNTECVEELEASLVHSLPARLETMEIWETQLENLINKCSEELEKKLEEQEKDLKSAKNIENKLPTRVRDAGCTVKQEAFPAVISLSKTWGIQFQNIAKKCSQGVKEEPEESTENEDTHIHPASHEETESSTVLESAVEETQCKDGVETCSVIPEPADEMEERSVHQASFEKTRKSEAYSFRAVVPPGWHSTLKSDRPVSYGWKVASLVKRFENLPEESVALQRDKIPVPPIQRSYGDQKSSGVKGSIQEVRDESKEAPEASAGKSTSAKSERKVHEGFSSAVVETSELQRKVFPKKIQLPKHGISDVTSLVMLNYEKPVYANIPPYTDVQIPLAVKDMVLDKFKDDWSRTKQHKIKRDSLRKSLTFRSRSEENFIPEYTEIEENSLYDDVTEEKHKGCLDKGGSDSGLSRSDATESSRNSTRSVEACSSTTCGEEQQRILQEATVDKAKSTGDIVDKSDKEGEEARYSCIPERSCQSLVLDQVSIGSSNISALVSCPARRSGVYNSYGSASSGTRKLPRIPTVASVGYYDSLTNRVDELEREKKVQEETAKQVSKAVLICRREQKMIKQDIQVEAEKILLVTIRKKDLIEKELILLNSDTPKETQPISVSVSMKNFNFSRAILSPASKQTKKYSWFFVLVLEAGTAVLASEVVKGDSDILFEDSFRFEGKLGDFPIHVKLYALSLKNHKQKNKNRHQMVSVPVPTKGYAPASYFSLWGSCKLRPSRLSTQGRNCFTLTQIPPDASISNTFSVDMKMHLKIIAFKRGFLTVGVEEPNRLPVWNRRWCVLDGAILKYWNYPIEEEVSEPVGQLDLVNARSHQVQLVCKELCPWPKCLSLDVERSESVVKEHFFSADTAEEFSEWQEQLNLVLGHLSKWKSSQEEVECRE